MSRTAEATKKRNARRQEAEEFNRAEELARASTRALADGMYAVALSLRKERGWGARQTPNCAPTRDNFGGLIKTTPAELVVTAVGTIRVGQRTWNLLGGKVALEIDVTRAPVPRVGTWTGLRINQLEADPPPQLILDVDENTIGIPDVGELWPVTPPGPHGRPGLSNDDAEEVIWRLLELTLGLTRVGEVNEGNEEL